MVLTVLTKCLLKCFFSPHSRCLGTNFTSALSTFSEIYNMLLLKEQKIASSRISCAYHHQLSLRFSSP